MGWLPAGGLSPRRGLLVLAGLTVALALPFVGCGPLLQLAGYPPEATRRTPPPGIESSATPAERPAPPFELAATTGWVKLSPRGRYLLVFYRGHW
ncbi:MAG: hypothetical protein AAGA56_25590 [Myxococcota bacterium]